MSEPEHTRLISTPPELVELEPVQPASVAQTRPAGRSGPTWFVAFHHRFPTGFALDFEHQFSGGTIGLAGPSGTGKSTLLAVLAGLLQPATARVQVDDQVWNDTQAGLLVGPRERRAVLVFQQPRLFPHLSVRDNLFYGLRRRDRRWWDCRGLSLARGAGEATHDSAAEIAAVEPSASEIIERFELGPLLDRRPETLSGGQQQRVSLARGWLAQPQHLLLDEPFTHLDETLQTELVALLRQRQQQPGLSTWIVDHDVERLRSMVEVFITLDRGRVVKCETCSFPLET